MGTSSFWRVLNWAFDGWSARDHQELKRRLPIRACRQKPTRVDYLQRSVVGGKFALV
jgi:hypothetical protein